MFKSMHDPNMTLNELINEIQHFPDKCEMASRIPWEVHIQQNEKLLQYTIED